MKPFASSTQLALAAALLIAAPTPALAQRLVASVQADGFSFGLGPASTNAGISLFFTTFDNSAGAPLRDCGPAFCTISQEWTPTSPGSSSYRADYLAEDNFGVFEYGAVSISASLSDSDRNGIPDQLSVDRSGNFSFNGTAVPHYNYFNIYSNASVSGSVVRRANNRTGTYSGTYVVGGNTVSFRGAMGLSGASGTLEYAIGESTVFWSLSQRGLDNVTHSYSGFGQMLRNGSNEISFPAFRLRESQSGEAIFVEPVTLTRVGNQFRGRARLADGEPLTSWADYRDFNVIIEDLNDLDRDGLPDLVSVPEPSSGAGAIAAVLALVASHRRHRISCG